MIILVPLVKEQDAVYNYFINNLVYNIMKIKEKMFGRNQKKQEFVGTNVEYMGGHPLYPQSFYGWIELKTDHLEIKKRIKDAPEIIIPYNQITDITNTTEDRYGRREAILFLPLGLIKEKHTYIIIHTHDSMTDKDISIVIDFNRKVEEAQRMIYNKMMAARKITL